MKNHCELFAEHGISLIHYELERVGSEKALPTPEITRQIANLGSSMRKHWSLALKYNILSKKPFFHPGRVLISNDVCCYLGKHAVQIYLNCYVRGDWLSVGDGWYREQPYTWTRHEFGGDLKLHIRTSPKETRTIVRFWHEKLKFLRSAQVPLK